MKKLMTMIAAVGMAFGLFADGPFVSGTNFNNEDPGTFAGGKEATLWSDFATDNQNKIVELAWTPAIDDMQPEEFALDGAGNSLAVKTTLGNPITRSCGDTAIEVNSYVDMMAQFTVFDQAPDFTAAGYADAKIALWLEEEVVNDEPTGETNVWLRAGNFATGAAASYNCGSIADPKYKFGDWNRVTIKSIVDVGGKQAFVVFVNGIALEAAVEDYTVGALPAGASAAATVWYNQRKLFPSIVNEQTVSSVSFDGQGGIDDIVFSTLADATHRAFAMDPAAYTISWNTAKMANITTNGVALTAEESAKGVLTVAGVAPASITIGWTGVGTWASGEYDAAKGTGDTFTVPDNEIKAAEATFNEVNWTLADAIAEANKATEAGTLKLLVSANAIALNNTVAITIDLGTCTLAGQDSDATITADAAIIVLNGTVNAGAGQNAIYANGCTINGGTFNGGISGEGFTINDGTFNGTVEATPVAIYGGKFLASANPNLAQNATFATGKTLVVDPTDEDYLIVGDIILTAKFYKDAAKTDQDLLYTAQVAYGATPVYGGETPAKEGFTFTGWNPALAPITADQDYVAVFEANNYAINYTWVDDKGAAVTPLANELPTTFTFGGAEIKLTAAMVTLTEDYTAVAFEPDTVSTDKAEAFAVTVTLTKKAADYPSYIPEGAPEEIKLRYAGWAQKYSVTDGEDKMDYYLLDCDPNDSAALEAAQKAFKIASIENVEGEWQVKVVNDKGEGELIGQNGQYKNGYVNIISVKTTKFPTAGEGADFFQAALTVQQTLKGE